MSGSSRPDRFAESAIIRPMLLAVDVGNTQTHLGVLEGDELHASWRVATEAHQTADGLAVVLSGLLELDGLQASAVSAVVVSSVVPSLVPTWRDIAERRLGAECLVVGPGMKTGMPILTDDPRELGADRLVNAIAAYDAVGDACVVVDFGTAITFDAVSSEGEYLGGIIGPGIEVSIEALAARAAKLPQIELAEPDSVIGKTTQASLQSGFVYGFAGAIDGVAARVSREMGEGAEFIATGGYAAAMAPLCERIDRVDPDLTLTGLRLIWEGNRQ